MGWVAGVLESLARYGIIDIFFGLGILAYLRRLFRRRTTQEIEGVEIMPRVSAIDGYLEIKIKNDSRAPLYLYRGTFTPGYRTSQLDTSSLRSFTRTLILTSWRTDRLPRVTEPSRTTRGDYLLQVMDSQGEEAESIFLEPAQAASYALGLEPVWKEDPTEIQRAEAAVEESKCGLFRVHFVHGTRSGVLEIQI
jgi:hypothetical protein